MSGFAVTPVAAFATQDDQGFPDFLQWQNQGADLGSSDADTVNVAEGLIATRGTGEDANVITLTADEATPFVLAWRETDTDDVVLDADVNNAIAFTGASPQQLTIPTGVITPGRAVLVTQEGLGTVEFIVPSGATLQFRDDVFGPTIAGPGGIVTLIGRADGVTILCGDMGLAA